MRWPWQRRANLGAPSPAEWDAFMRRLKTMRAEAPPKSLLTHRQTEVLALAATGLTNQQIADVLGVKMQTVKYHLSEAYVRLGTKNRTGAVNKARELGVL